MQQHTTLYDKNARKTRHIRDNLNITKVIYIKFTPTSTYFGRKSKHCFKIKYMNKELSLHLLIVVLKYNLE